MAVNGTMPCGPTIQQILSAARTGLVWKMDGAALLTITGSLSKGDKVEANLREGWLKINGVHVERRIDVLATNWVASFAPGLHSVESQDGGAMEARWHTEWA